MLDASNDLGPESPIRAPMESFGDQVFGRSHEFEALQADAGADGPFRRPDVAQARIESLTVVTRDERFAPYGVELLAA